jgi:hypothetical protein
MSIAIAVNWRRSGLASASATAYTRVPPLVEYSSAAVQASARPIWPADVPAPFGPSLTARPDVKLAVVWSQRGT